MAGLEPLHIVAWRGLFRVITESGQVVAVCFSYEEAEAYIAGQPEEDTA